MGRGQRAVESDVARQGLLDADRAAAEALDEWRRTPATERIQYLFKLKYLLEEHFEDIARTITMECGKTIAESRGEMRRAIENVEVACGIPLMMQGNMSEDIAPGIDELLIRQPVGVCAAIAPFNFPGMIVFWFLPYALACGNTYIVKPSEKVPMTMQKVFHLLQQARFFHARARSVRNRTCRRGGGTTGRGGTLPGDGSPEPGNRTPAVSDYPSISGGTGARAR